MKAMILAAGEGTRLRPLTLTMPKPLVPVAGVPVIEYILRWLKSHDINAVAINLHHLADRVMEFIGDGSRFGVRIVYSPETTLLGTAGGVKRMADFFDDTFVVVYGDVLTDFNLSAMVRFHRHKKAVATLALINVPNPWEVGVVEIDPDGRVLDFVEKPPRGSERGTLGSGGVYILEKEILDYVPDGVFWDFAYHVFPEVIRLGLPVYGYCLNNGDHLLDIGSLEKYRQANEDMRRTGALEHGE